MELRRVMVLNTVSIFKDTRPGTLVQQVQKTTYLDSQEHTKSFLISLALDYD